MEKKPYHNLTTEAQNSRCYIWSVARYSPDGGVKSLQTVCTEEEYDELAEPDKKFLELLIDGFLTDKDVKL